MKDSGALRIVPGQTLGTRRLAVLVVGQTQRYYPMPTLRHVVAPAARAGYRVDYHVMLSRGRARSAAELSPWTGDCEEWPLRPVENPVLANLSMPELERLILRLSRRFGADNANVKLLPEDVGLDPLPRNASWRRWFGWRSGAHRHSFLHFHSFVNTLARFKKIEMLWNLTSAVGRLYSHVVLTRDDIYWLDDLDLARFQDPTAIYSGRRLGICAEATDALPNDQAIVLGGLAADRFLRLHTEYYHNQHAELDSPPVAFVEDFLWRLARLQGTRWEAIVRRQHAWQRLRPRYHTGCASR